MQLQEIPAAGVDAPHSSILWRGPTFQVLGLGFRAEIFMRPSRFRFLAGHLCSSVLPKHSSEHLSHSLNSLKGYI